MSDIKLFNSEAFGAARILPEGDSFWIVGVDVLRALDYAEGSLDQVTNVFASVPTEWVHLKPIKVNLSDGREQTRNMLCLSEQGLYFFLARSDKPKALPFQKWIAGDVLPSIRKTGEYVIEKPQVANPAALERLQMAELILAHHYEGNQLVLALDKVHIHLTGESVLKLTHTELVAPQQQQLYTPTEIGKQVEPPHTARQINQLLAAMQWQIKVGDHWEAVNEGVQYAVYLDTGKAHSNGTPIRQMKWTSDVIFVIQSRLQGA